MANISAHYWLAMLTLTASIVLYAVVAWRAFLFRPPVTLMIGTGIAFAVLVATVAPDVGEVLAALGLATLVGWQGYYVYKDWASRPLRWLAVAFLACILVTGALLVTR